MKVMLSKKAIDLLEIGLSPSEAAKASLAEMKRKVDGSGGIIIVNNKGEVGFHFTTERMAWAFIKDGNLVSGIDKK